MKRYYLLWALSCLTMGLFAQKPVIDKHILESWRVADGGSISNDGNYVSYKIRNLTGFGNGVKFVIRSMKSSKELVLHSDTDFSSDFSEDSKNLYFQKNDSVGTVDLKTMKVDYVSGIASYKLFKKDDKECMLIRKVANDEMLIRGFPNHVLFTRKHVNKFWLSSNGSRIYFTAFDSQDVNGQRLYVTDLQLNKTQEICKVKTIENLILNSQGDQIAFIVIDNRELIRRYRYDINKLDSFSLRSFKEIRQNETFTGLAGFSYDGKRLFLNFQGKSKKYEDLIKVNIWSYRDPVLQTAQQQRGTPSYLLSIDLVNGFVSRLQDEKEHLDLPIGTPLDGSGLVIKRIGDQWEYNWNLSAHGIYYYVNTITGQRTEIPLSDGTISRSPNGKYFLGRDTIYTDLYSYDPVGLTLKNVTKSIRFPDWHGLKSIPPMQFELALGGWLPNDKGVLIYDKFDIWLCDPKGIKNPVCLTDGFGRKYNITFRITIRKSGEGQVFQNGEELILTAFNNETKDNGFYSLNIGKEGSLRKLTMGPYVFETPQALNLGGWTPVKAKNNSSYLVLRSDAKTAPNYFYTRDFKHFEPISSVHPEKNCNWQRTKLFTWKTKHSDSIQGVLHYPENLDITKKYPVIINYYENKSDELNQFPDPGYTHGLLNIPWFVSHGYLVFTPDIPFRRGFPGQSTMEAVESAASLLSSLDYVDSTKIGIQGHSFSGFTTNYIVSHSSRFAAAAAGAGPSDLINFYNSSFGLGGSSRQTFVETGSFNLGSLWENPDFYLENSPILKADEVKTPLLQMHNPHDGLVPLSQGLELHLALRRLGKRSWLLQYDDEGHHVLGKETSEDYTLRLMQYFDHYLKGKPAPVWMTRGIPAKDKGVQLGYEFDDKIKTPGAGLVPDKSK